MSNVKIVGILFSIIELFYCLFMALSEVDLWDFLLNFMNLILNGGRRFPEKTGGIGISKLKSLQGRSGG